MVPFPIYRYYWYRYCFRIYHSDSVFEKKKYEKENGIGFFQPSSSLIYIFELWKYIFRSTNLLKRDISVLSYHDHSSILSDVASHTSATCHTVPQRWLRHHRHCRIDQATCGKGTRRVRVASHILWTRFLSIHVNVHPTYGPLDGS